MEHPRVAYPMNVGLNWYSAKYIPQKNGGKSLPMDDGIDIAKKKAFKNGKTEDGYRVDKTDAPFADKKNQAFKIGTDKDYMALKGSGNQAAPGGNDGKGDFSQDASLYNDGGHEIDPPGVHGQE